MIGTLKGEIETELSGQSAELLSFVEAQKSLFDQQKTDVDAKVLEFSEDIVRFKKSVHQIYSEHGHHTR